MDIIAEELIKIAGDSMRATLMHIAQYQFSETWCIGPTSHAHYEMLIFLAGRHWTAMDGEEYISRAGDVMLFQPGQVHQEKTSKATWLCLSFELEKGVELAPQMHDSGGRVRLLGEWLLAEFERAVPSARALANSFLESLLLELQESLKERRMPLVETVRAFAQSRLSSRITVDMLAQEANLSKYHFIRHYRDLTGVSPMADVRRIRLEQAWNLVTNSDLPLKAITSRVGLGEPAAFSRLFKKHFGMSPSELRAPASQTP